MRVAIKHISYIQTNREARKWKRNRENVESKRKDEANTEASWNDRSADAEDWKQEKGMRINSVALPTALVANRFAAARRWFCSQEVVVDEVRVSSTQNGHVERPIQTRCTTSAQYRYTDAASQRL